MPSLTVGARRLLGGAARPPRPSCKLPTFLMNFAPDRPAVCSREGYPIVTFALSVMHAELEEVDRERRIVSGASRRRFPVIKSLDEGGHRSSSSLNKTLVLELARCEYIERRRTSSRSATGAQPPRPTSPSVLGRPARRASRSASAPPPQVHELLGEARDDKQLLRFQREGRPPTSF